MHSTLPPQAPNSDILNYEWWQLFDCNTKTFYYYNIKKQITTWRKPDALFKKFDDDSNNDNNDLINNKVSNYSQDPIYPLTSKMLKLLMNNMNLFNNDLNGKCISELIRNIKEKSLINIENDDENKEENQIDAEISLLLKELEYSLFLSNKNNSSSVILQHSISQNTINSKNTRRQPRTNPNYVNVDLIDHNQDAKMIQIKNTYVKVDDLNNHNGKLLATTSKPSQSENISENKPISFQTLTKSFLILLSLLKGVDLRTTSSNGIKKNKLNNNNKFTKLRNQNSITSSSSTILLTNRQPAQSRSDIKENEAHNKNFKSSSLTRKEKERNSTLIKASTALDFTLADYGSSNLTINDKQGEQEEDGKISSNYDPKFYIGNDENNSFSINNNFSRSYIADNKRTCLADDKQRKNQQDSSLSCLTPIIQAKFNKNETNTSNNMKNQEYNIFNSISASSITDIRNLYQQKHTQFNQKFQTLRRSLNNKSSNSKKLMCSYSESNSKKLTSTPCTPLNDEKLKQIHDNSNILDDFSFSNSDNKKYSKINILLSDQNFSDQEMLPKDESETISNTSKSSSSNFSFFSSKKKDSAKDLLTWSNQTIQKPLIKTQNKVIKKEACELFKLIQTYMGDRKLVNNFFMDLLSPDLKPYFSNQQKQNNSIFSSFKSLNDSFKSVAKLNENMFVTQQDIIVLEIIKKGWTYCNLRDELFLQIIKQTTSNLNVESFLLGWQLMAICLSFFPPSQKLYPLMNDYILFHSKDFDFIENIFYRSNSILSNNNSLNNSKKESKKDLKEKQQQEQKLDEKEIREKFDKTAQACHKRLQRINITGAKKGLKSPLLEEVILSKNTIFTPSLFGTSLQEIMYIQKRKFPHLALPWIQTTLSEAVIRLEGAKIEGIFRVPGDLDEVNNLKVRMDQIWCSLEDTTNKNNNNNNNKSIDAIANITDPHLPASLLKLWYRELYDPLIPNEFYNECIENCDNPDKCIQIVEKLPEINRLVFSYLIRFLKIFAAKENVASTKMDANNLSMIMAPNCLRCKSNEAKVIMENTKKEMQFIKTLIQHLDTSIINGLN